MVGDLKKSGYFGKEKKHQTTLPKWALDLAGVKIYRSGGSRSGSAQKKDAWDDYCAAAVARVSSPVKSVDSKTYKERIDLCGQYIKGKLVSAGETIEATFKFPYRKFVKQFKGVYIKGEGYVSKISQSDVSKLMGVIEKVTLYSRHKKCIWLKELVGLERWKYHLQVIDYRGG
ncbi:unnamed protein product [marine sediment metagenome]|uniref:Uncharacterized protein n=1 Tax=marine sediment metagenome TaxID=412755 RepID=X1RKU8_9ZZZZ